MQTDLQQLLAALPPGVTRATRLSLSLAPETPPTMRQELLARLTHLSRATTGERHTLTAWLGDLLASAGRLRRGQITAYAHAAGLDAGTLSNAKLVCSRIPASCRHEGLSWSHHCEVALIFSAPGEIELWLALADARNLSAGDLRLSIRSHLATAQLPTQQEDPGGFTLMRELRSAARKCRQMKPVWQNWQPAGRRLALEELRPLVEFVDHLRRRAARHAGPLDNIPGPRDPTTN